MHLSTTVNLLAKTAIENPFIDFFIKFMLPHLRTPFSSFSLCFCKKCTQTSTFEGVVINVLLSYQRTSSWVMIYENILFLQCQCRCFDNLLLHCPASVRQSLETTCSKYLRKGNYSMTSRSSVLVNLESLNFLQKSFAQILVNTQIHMLNIFNSLNFKCSEHELS